MEHNIKPGVYKHFKGGEFEVLAIVRHSETLESLVLYKHLDEDVGLWVRPVNIFLEEVDKPGLGYKGPRFRLVRKTKRMEY